MLFLMPARSEKGRQKGWDGLGAEVWVNHKSGAASQGERMEDVGCKGTIKAWIFYERWMARTTKAEENSFSYNNCDCSNIFN